MRFGDDVDITGCRHNNISRLNCFAHRHNPGTVHDRFKSFECVDFRNDYVGAHAPGFLGNAARTPAIPRDDKSRPGDQAIGSADDPVKS